MYEVPRTGRVDCLGQVTGDRLAFPVVALGEIHCVVVGPGDLGQIRDGEYARDLAVLTELMDRFPGIVRKASDQREDGLGAVEVLQLGTPCVGWPREKPVSERPRAKA